MTDDLEARADGRLSLFANRRPPIAAAWRDVITMMVSDSVKTIVGGL